MKRRHQRGLYAPELLESRIAPATFIVTSLLDDGDGNKLTLREAIDAANTQPDKDTITFASTVRGESPRRHGPRHQRAAHHQRPRRGLDLDRRRRQVARLQHQ